MPHPTIRRLAAVLALLLPVALQGQDSARTTSVVRRDRPNLLTVQPMHAVFGSYSAEYERFVGTTVSVAGGLTYTDGEVLDWDDYGDDETISTDVKLRYYPSARSFDGFSVGLQLGARRDRVSEIVGDPPRWGEMTRKWFPSVGFLMERGWLDQRTGRMLFAAGIGAKRVIRSDYLDDETYLTLRLAVGLAF